jgi:hypothetical protein
MQQLRQRVIASYHLGPMDAQETRAYIEHRLHTVGWNGDPGFDDAAHAAIFAYTGGIPRKTNTLLDRVLLMGYLEELHHFTEAHIQTVIADVSEEFELPEALRPPAADIGGELLDSGIGGMQDRRDSVDMLDERMMRLEKSIVSVLSILKKIVATPPNGVQATQHVDTPE